MSAAAFPNWVMLEPFVFRRDDDEYFPDETKAPIRASGTTSWNTPFRFAFQLEQPPLVSRLYAHLPGFPEPRQQKPLAILATHRHLVLIRVGIRTPEEVLVQDFFIYDGAADDPSSSLKPLPPCTEPDMRRLPRRKEEEKERRLLEVRSMGLLCRGEQGFAVAELKLFKASRNKVTADICFLRSRSSSPSAWKWNACFRPSSSSSGGPALKWNSMRLPIDCRGNNAEQLYYWATDTVIPSHHGLCYIDYWRGILICDLLGDEPTPTVSFLRFPLHDFPPADEDCRIDARSFLYHGASAVDDGRELKFVNITRDDGIPYGPLKPGTGFTITCHTLTLGTLEWSRDYTVTSHELWLANDDCLPKEILMLPQVSIDKPNVVHYLISEYKYVMKKMWVVSIDMYTKKVESFYKYIDGRQDRATVDADLTQAKSSAPMPFLPCEFSKFISQGR